MRGLKIKMKQLFIDGDLVGLKLNNGTVIMVNGELNENNKFNTGKGDGIRIGYPKKKFAESFQRMINNPEKEFIEVIYNGNELEQIKEAIIKIVNDMNLGEEDGKKI